MASMVRYNIAAFDYYVSTCNSWEVHSGFQAISNADFCTFEEKAYTNKNGVAARAYMVLVGPYFYHYGNQVVWARATGLEVEYYHGPPTATVVTPVQPRDRYRIYHDNTSFRFIGAHIRMSDRGRHAAWALTETVINYLFLSRRLLGDVKVTKDTDVLDNFTQACIIYNNRKAAEEDEERIKNEQFEENEEDQAAFRAQVQRERTAKEQYPRIKVEAPDGDGFYSRAGSVSMDDGVSAQSPYHGRK
jgi:hypothetical protein